MAPPELGNTAQPSVLLPRWVASAQRRLVVHGETQPFRDNSEAGTVTATMQRHHLLSGFRRWDYFLAFCCAIAFLVALVGGSGLGSLKYLAWGAWWLLLGTFWVRQARQSRQHAQLRARRLRREELGLAPRRGD